MYRALKTAQTEVNESLLKLADEIMSASQSNMGVSSSDTPARYDLISSAIKQLHVNSSAQFQAISEELKELNANMLKIANLLVAEKPASLSVTTTIPNIQPVSSERDMVESVLEKQIDESALEEVEEEVEEAEEEVEEEVEEAEEEAEEEVEEAEVEEAEVEVEEWFYKGRSFFKDSNNVVYANDGGEVGDAIGTYDPIKMTVRKING
jgi:vacuolar-type H+-ATPase subunit H